jgi:hypothetical protein
MLPKKGNVFPGRSTPKEIYAGAIADALRTELGQSHRATKTLMKWTGASDRTAKNWLNGNCGPSGDHLITLAKESDTVLAALLGLAGRHGHMAGVELLTIRNHLWTTVQALDDLLGGD